MVKATWIEDEAETTQEWEVNAETAHDAVKAATTHIRFPPHHVEARRGSAEDEKRARGLRPGEARARQ